MIYLKTHNCLQLVHLLSNVFVVRGILFGAANKTSFAIEFTRNGGGEAGWRRRPPDGNFYDC